MDLKRSPQQLLKVYVKQFCNFVKAERVIPVLHSIDILLIQTKLVSVRRDIGYERTLITIFESPLRWNISSAGV